MFFAGVLAASRHANDGTFAVCGLAVLIFAAMVSFEVGKLVAVGICVGFVLLVRLCWIWKPSILNQCYLTIWLLIVTYLRDFCRRVPVDAPWVFDALKHMFGV